MFHRDHGAAEEDSSIDPRIWPSHFRRATTGPDHFPRKSSDQVIQQLRDELDKHRQMFFNRLPTQWESTSPRVNKLVFKIIYTVLGIVPILFDCRCLFKQRV